jgi:hypothetical protein
VAQVVQSVADKYTKTAAQVLLRWACQRGTVPITTTRSASRLQEYLDAAGPGCDWTLDDDSMDSISSAGAEVPARTFWTWVPGFLADPREEEDTSGPDVNRNITTETMAYAMHGAPSPVHSKQGPASPVNHKSGSVRAFF